MQKISEVLKNLDASIASKNYSQSIACLNIFFEQINRNYGGFTSDFIDIPSMGFKGKQFEYLANLLATSITNLFIQPDFQLNQNDFYRLLLNHRNFAFIFGATAFKNADHILRALEFNKHTAQKDKIDYAIFYKACLLYSLDSNFAFNFNETLKLDPRLAVSLGISLIASPVAASQEASYKRDIILQWLPYSMQMITDIRILPITRMHDAYMNCSYSDIRTKHALKKEINRLLKGHMETLLIRDPIPPTLPSKNDKPVIFVILEWFTENHSIFRTHSRSIVSLKESFKVIGIGYPKFTDKVTQKIFDAFYELPSFDMDLNFAKEAVRLANEHQPCAIYYPSMGMSLHTIYLSNLRLAKVQMIALGHPATTHCPSIDYVLVEEDYIGSTQCFEEKVVALPKDSLPYIPPNTSAYQLNDQPKNIKKSGIVKVAIALSILKINFNFLILCKRIAEEAEFRVEFHFMMGSAIGFIYPYAKNMILDVLPDAKVHPQLPYELYFSKIRECDLFINPFPFGNTNGLVDTVKAYLPGICFTGPEVHTHIDEGLFKRLGLPDWTITNTIDAYVEATLKLINDPALRQNLTDEIKRIDPDTILFSGDPKKFHDVVRNLII